MITNVNTHTYFNFDIRQNAKKKTFTSFNILELIEVVVLLPQAQMKLRRIVSQMLHLTTTTTTTATTATAFNNKITFIQILTTKIL